MCRFYLLSRSTRYLIYDLRIPRSTIIRSCFLKSICHISFPTWTKIISTLLQLLRINLPRLIPIRYNLLLTLNLHCLLLHNNLILILNLLYLHNRYSHPISQLPLQAHLIRISDLNTLSQIFLKIIQV